MDDADADGWRWGARARWTVFAGVLRDANALAALARSAMGTCDPARAFGAMRAREACGVTTRRGGEGTREATGRVEASRDASARTRYQGDWLDVGEVCGRGKTIEDYVSRWRAGPFEPYGGRRKDCAYAVCGAEDATRRGAAALMREISREYELCGLGKHEPMVEGDDGSVFEPVGDGFRRGGARTLDGFSRALSAAAQRAAELASRKSQMCVVYVIIPDDMREIDALTLIALASHVMSEATTAVDRRFLSVSVQAVPESWCRDAFAWSAASVRAMAFNVFLKLARPMIVRRVPLSKDNLDAAPRSARVAENASGREGVSGAAVVGRREPHPLFKTPETDTNRTIPSFPAYEPLYALTPLIDEDNAASVSSMERGLHCAYIVVASRWIVASWSDSNGEFFSIEAEPFASSNDVETNGMRWLIDRTSALSEQLSFAYGKKASAWLKFERVVICRVGPWSTTERDALARACDESFPEPLEREFLTLVEMTCVEPDDVGVRISAFASSTKNISFVTESDDASKTARTYALPPTSARESRVAFGASASSVCLRAADETIDGETLRRLCELYATRLSQLGMMCLSETAVDDFGRVRAPLPLHAEACVRFAATIQALEVHGGSLV
jgi:type IV secretory pathway VirB3-like protein